MADTIATRALSEPDRLLKRRRLDELLHRITHGAGAGTSSLNNNIYEPSLSLEKYYLKDPVAVVAVPHRFPYSMYSSEDINGNAMSNVSTPERFSPTQDLFIVMPNEQPYENVCKTPKRLSLGSNNDMYCTEVFDADAISNASTPPPISPALSNEYSPLPEFDLFALFDIDENNSYNEGTMENKPSPKHPSSAPEQNVVDLDDHINNRRGLLEEEEPKLFTAAPKQPAVAPGHNPSNLFSAAETHPMDTKQNPMDHQPPPKRRHLPLEQETPLDLSTKKECQPLVGGAWGDNGAGWRALPPLRQLVLPAGLEGAPLTLALSPVNAVVEQVPNDTGLAYPCLDCGQLFCLQDRLAKHIASRHRKPGAKERAARAYRCEVCQSTFARSDMLTRHARLHTGVKPYSCAECGQVFTRSDHLATHQRTHTGEKPYKCALCEYAACRRDMISRHMRTHSKHYLFAPRAARGRRGHNPAHP